MVPEQFRPEQQAVEALIREAFRGVTREGGVSWSESVVNDNYGSPDERAAARASDTEPGWEALVDDPAWDHEPGVGGFNFLDPIGFRYYLAPAMIRCIRDGYGEFTAYALGIDSDFKRRRIELIDAKQAAAIARFLRLMVSIRAAEGDVTYGEMWAEVYQKHWRDRDPQAEPA